MFSQPVLARENREDLFTHEECVQILSNFLNGNQRGKLVSFKIVSELNTIGYLGEYYHLHLSYQLENQDEVLQTRLFVKAVPFKTADLAHFNEMSGLAKKESILYDTLLNKLRKYSKNIWCARCYLAKNDVFVLENIVDLGYEPCQDSRKFLIPSQVYMLLKGLATMHASSIAYELEYKVNIGEQLKEVLFEPTVSPKIEWFLAGRRALVAVALKHPLYQSDEAQKFIREKLNDEIDKVYEMVNTSEKYRNVFCHRDPWGGNVFFKRDNPNRVGTVFVDFQLCRYSPPAIDVLMTTHLNLEPKSRRSIHQKLCSNYYEYLIKELESMGLNAAQAHITQEQFNDSLKNFALFGAVYNSVAATVLRVPGNYLKDMKMKRPADFYHYINVDRTEEVLELMRTNTAFSDYMFDCIEDILCLLLT